jgi:bacillithiol system protein YtxJ
MNWIHIVSETQLQEAVARSREESVPAVLIYKHSTRCSISLMTRRSLEQTWDLDDNVPVYFLDLISFRTISNKIAEDFGVTHESPQVLLLKNGECIFHTSHGSIAIQPIKEKLGL